MYDEIKSADDEWFQTELLKLDCSKLVRRYYTPLELDWPRNDGSEPVIRRFIVTVDCYENDNTGFEIIGFSTVLKWAREHGYNNPENLRVRVHSLHTNFSGVLSKCGVCDDMINEKLHELEDWPIDLNRNKSVTFTADNCQINDAELKKLLGVY